MTRRRRNKKIDDVPRPSTNGDRLNEVFKIIDINQEDREEDILYFDAVWKTVCDKLRDDTVFKDLERGGAFAGEHGLGVKINKSDKYDFQLYFCLPRSDELVVTPTDGGDAQINIKNVLLGRQSYPISVIEKLEDLTDDEFFLIPSKINNWFRDLMETHIPSWYTFKIGENTFQFIHSKHGSSQQVRITVNEESFFDVCIHPVIKLQANKHWVAEKKLVRADASFWTATTLKVKGEPRSFQCCYENIEKTMLRSINGLTDALKLMMKIRDKDDLSVLEIRDLKSVCLQFAERNKQHTSSKRNTKTVLIAVFKDLLQSLSQQELLVYWDCAYDVIEMEVLTGRFKNPLHRHLSIAFKKVERDDVEWAFCNRNERLFYYKIPKKLDYRNRKGQYKLMNIDHPIPDDMGH